MDYIFGPTVATGEEQDTRSFPVATVFSAPSLLSLAAGRLTAQAIAQPPGTLFAR